jgi:hypothetical protein
MTIAFIAGLHPGCGGLLDVSTYVRGEQKSLIATCLRSGHSLKTMALSLVLMR